MCNSPKMGQATGQLHHSASFGQGHNNCGTPKLENQTLIYYVFIQNAIARWSMKEFAPKGLKLSNSPKMGQALGQLHHTATLGQGFIG